MRGVPLDAVVPDAHADRLVLKELQRGGDAGPVSREHLTPRLLIAEGECEVLGRADGEIPATDALQLDEPLDDLTRFGIERSAAHQAIGLGAAQREAGVRIAALDQADDRAGLGRALETEQLRAGTPPGAGPLAPLGVVVIETATERVLVILRTGEIHRRDAQHGRRPLSGTARRASLPAAPGLRSHRSRRAPRAPGPKSRPVMRARELITHRRCNCVRTTLASRQVERAGDRERGVSGGWGGGLGRSCLCVDATDADRAGAARGCSGEG